MRFIRIACTFVFVDQQAYFVGGGQVFELKLFSPETARQIPELFGSCSSVQLVVHQNFDVILFLLVCQSLCLQDVKPEGIFCSPPVLVPHQGLLQALHPLVSLPGALAGEVPGRCAGGVSDLKPGVLTNDGWVHSLNRDLVRIQVQSFDEALKIFQNFNF